MAAVLVAALLLPACVDEAASETHYVAIARQWADRLGIRVKGMECNWAGHCTMVTETEVVAITCYKDRCYRDTGAK